MDSAELGEHVRREMQEELVKNMLTLAGVAVGKAVREKTITVYKKVRGQT